MFREWVPVRQVSCRRERTSPELQYLQAKFAALMSYGLTVGRRTTFPGPSGVIRRRAQRWSEEERLFSGSDVEPDCAFLSRCAGRPWRTTHGAAGERERFLLNVMAEHFPTEDHVRREANERRGGFRGHRVWVRCRRDLPEGFDRSDDCTRAAWEAPRHSVAAADAASAA